MYSTEIPFSTGQGRLKGNASRSPAELLNATIAQDHLLNLALAATVLAIALGYYFGHNFINRLMVDGGTEYRTPDARQRASAVTAASG